ncbi:hypothetical protein EGR_06388 [Echinococcus granulosus]|uniref:Uncharacterized protein n=1 Tax=Echinococcus granulosus TaxID=6210 RepID=W6UKU9_ECHGR|nr:hypothetical protein EGR_06388 [Echinococcus granulosus]EUB58717.1 hypothetical protein EGR_06388 [Echinococcus granulosus]
MNITVASDVDVTTERVTTFSEASEGEPSMTAVGDPIVTSEEPTNLSMSMDTLGDKTVAIVLLTVILCGAFVIVCLLLGWTTSIAHLKTSYISHESQSPIRCYFFLSHATSVNGSSDFLGLPAHIASK